MNRKPNTETFIVGKNEESDIVVTGYDKAYAEAVKLVHDDTPVMIWLVIPKRGIKLVTMLSLQN